MSEMVEFTLEQSGHTWVIRCPAGRLDMAIDAAFEWFVSVDEFGVPELRDFNGAILMQAVALGQMEASEAELIQKIVCGVLADAKIPPFERVKCVRAILSSALHSEA